MHKIVTLNRKGFETLGMYKIVMFINESLDF